MMDHLINPTLNESFFLTKVYHVNGTTGQDGGVMYKELEREKKRDER